MDDATQPIERRTFDAQDLVAQHPPRWRDANKRLVAEVSCPPGSTHRGALGFTRWAAMPLPPDLEPMDDGFVKAVPGFYDYHPAQDPAGAIEWHVNFADPHLFDYCGGGLLAQDELQVAEHPALGALKEALSSAGIAATTLGSAGPTPILVTGVERRVAIATNPDPAAGRPRGLYGNAFAQADPEVVRRAATRIDPPTISNLVAMSAPPGGHGAYRAGEIESILVTAMTGFRAAVIESARIGPAGAAVVVHTGFWGCGAFGGNRVLMALLQVVAARLAGLDRLVFHTGGPGGEAPLAEGLETLARLTGGVRTDTSRLIAALATYGFRWGVSNGT